MITKFKLFENLEDQTLNGAIDRKDITLIKKLIDSGVDVNKKSVSGWLPLKFAMWNDIETIKLLIRAGAKINVEIFNYLLCPPGTGPDNVNAKAKLLIDCGFDLNDKDFTTQTPLIKASINNYINVMRFLLNAGADPFITDNRNKCFIDYLNNQNLNKIKNEYQEIYNEYIMKKDAEKYNL